MQENTDDYIMIADSSGYPVVFNSAYAGIMKEAFGIDMKPGMKPHKLLSDKDAVTFWDKLYNRVLGGVKHSRQSILINLVKKMYDILKFPFILL